MACHGHMKMHVTSHLMAYGNSSLNLFFCLNFVEHCMFSGQSQVEESDFLLECFEGASAKCNAERSAA